MYRLHGVCAEYEKKFLTTRYFLLLPLVSTVIEPGVVGVALPSGCLVVRRCQFRYRYFSFLQHSVLSPTTAFIASNCARGRRGNIVISISGCLVVRCCQFRYFSVLRLKVWIDNLNNRRDFLCVPVNLRRRCPL